MILNFILLAFIKIIRKLFDLTAVIIGPKTAAVKTKEYKLSFGKIRIYQPNQDSEVVLVYYHGGGWVTGSIIAYEPICKYLSNKAQITVISVDYRLASEFKFPTNLNDATEAFLWVQNNFHGKKIMIAGDSAGGNLAAQLAIKFANIIKAQILIYPVVDMTTSYRYDKSQMLYRVFNFFFKICLIQYLPYLSKRNDPTLSPLYYDQISTLPPTILVSAGIDILIEQNFSYVDKLINNKVHVVHYHYKDMLHGFLQFSGINTKAKDALDQIVSFISNHKN